MAVIQPKLTINQPGDRYEQEADQVADKIVRMKDSDSLALQPMTLSPVLMVHRKVVGREGGTEAPSIVSEMLNSGTGKPLEPPTRQFMESRFGQDFSGVRVQTDAKASESAATIQARAYTSGNQIVFGKNEYQPETATGQHLLAHELVHVKQQNNANSLVIQRDIGLNLMPPQPSFEELWGEFERHLYTFRNDEALRVALELSQQIDFRGALNHGYDLASWLLSQNQITAAQRVLEEMDTFDWIRDVSIRPITPGFMEAYSLYKLVDRGIEAGRNGNRDLAFQILALAVFHAQIQIQLLSEQRKSTLKADSDQQSQYYTDLENASTRQDRRRAAAMQSAFMLPNLIGRLFNYQNLSGYYSQLRRSLTAFTSLQREAILAGNSADVSRFGQLQLDFLGHLKAKNFILNESLGMTLESSRSAGRRGEVGYTVHGQNDAEEFITPLPGTLTPSEMGLFPAYSYNMEELTGDIAGQELIINELLSFPSISTQFRNGAIDLNNQATRIHVWTLVFKDLTQHNAATALESLIRLMERYLRFFTAHSEYNIRDSGTSYLESRFPEDLVGRVLRDCGVYAMTIAYELFSVGRATRPRLNLRFELFSLPEHVTMAIVDGTANNHYVLNNDSINGPHSGANVISSVANAYAQTFDRGFAITPAMSVNLGDTSQSNSQFRTGSWERYQAITSWGFRTEPLTSSEDTRSEHERSLDAYRHYYENIRTFNEQVGHLNGFLNRLSTDLILQSTTSQQVFLDSEINAPNIHRQIMSLFAIYYLYGPGAFTLMAVDPSLPRNQMRHILKKPKFLYSVPSSIALHPLNRFGRVLLLWEHLGGVLSSDHQNMLTILRSTPDFSSDLTQYTKAGFPLSF